MYTSTNETCGFCVTQPTSIGRLEELGIKMPIVPDMDCAVEAYLTAMKEFDARLGTQLNNSGPCGTRHCRCRNLLITGGSPFDRRKEARNYIRLIEAFRKADDRAVITVETQALEKEDLKTLHEVGLHCIMMNLEVWDEKMFQVICPGKAKHVGREYWLDSLVTATEFYDRGHVVSNFPVGLEMYPPEGFKEEEEALESNLTGFEWLMQRGVSPSWTVVSPSSASWIKHMPLPSTEYYLKIGLESHKLHLKYDLYTPSRGFFCYRMAFLMPCADFARLRWESDERNVAQVYQPGQCSTLADDR